MMTDLDGLTDAQREAMEEWLALEYTTSDKHAIGPDSFRRGWIAAFKWLMGQPIK